MIHGVTWLISRQYIGDSILGWSLLESLGLTIRGLQAAAAAKYTEGITEAELLQGVTPMSDQGRVSRVLQCVFHSEGADGPQDN